MSVYSRREILLKAFGGLREKPLEESVEKNDGSLRRKGVVSIGKLSGFPVGSKTFLPEFAIYLESFAEGLRAFSNENPEECFTVQVGARGDLTVDFTKPCASGYVFSILTNEPVCLR